MDHRIKNVSAVESDYLLLIFCTKCYDYFCLFPIIYCGLVLYNNVNNSFVLAILWQNTHNPNVNFSLPMTQGPFPTKSPFCHVRVGQFLKSILTSVTIGHYYSLTNFLNPNDEINLSIFVPTFLKCNDSKSL